MYAFNNFQIEHSNINVVLLRKYGNNTSILVDREAETEIIKTLSKEGICMPLYAILNNGIAYGFVHGEKLTVDTVRDEHISRLIAKEMAKLHSIKTKKDNPKPSLFDKLDTWIEYIPNTHEDPVLPSRYLILSTVF
ncbi:hypothetical protein KUTeg_022798 [Tegillarca granosa]|uniref:ethanolamine kinase n=1 Tax=Tegillarca granosa TaxID=220873 RepID=A0ABQ9E626_TEGGR|nr:hypothetical protein KUTeg_022798 [Tegillarca granosa]